MEESQYIFQQTETLFVIGLIVSALIVIVGVYQLIQHFVGNDYYDRNGTKVNRRINGIAAFVLSGVMIIGVASSTNKIRRIKRNYAETIGRTIRTYYSRGYFVEYEFIVENKRYTNNSERTYSGETITVDAPNGHYKVIYNKLDPTESIMDCKVKK
jgi:amino acid permease